jgi:hypothetical protein
MKEDNKAMLAKLMSVVRALDNLTQIADRQGQKNAAAALLAAGASVGRVADVYRDRSRAAVVIKRRAAV